MAGVEPRPTARLDRRALLPLALVLALGAPVGARAATVALAFEGELGAVEDPEGLLEHVGELAPGDPFSGRLEYEVPGRDLDDDPRLGFFEQSAPGLLSAEVDGVRFRRDPTPASPFETPFDLEVLDGEPGASADRVRASLGGLPPAVVAPLVADEFPLSGRIDLRAADESGTALASDALPSGATLAGLPTRTLEIEATLCTFERPQFCGTSPQPSFLLRGEIDSLRLVPGPAAGGALALGALVALRVGGPSEGRRVGGGRRPPARNGRPCRPTAPSAPPRSPSSTAG